MIDKMPSSQVDDHVTIHVGSMDEYFQATVELTGEDEDVLSPNSLFLRPIE